MSQTQHPLMQDEPTYYGGWKEWKEAWKDPHIENRFSLLFCGFGAPVSRQEEVAERICFYLDVANGHESHSGFQEQGDRSFACRIRTALGEFQNIADMRRFLAEKAFQALCLHFFKNTEKGYLPEYMPSWACDVVVPEVLGKLIWFFTEKNETGWRGNIPLHRQDHHAETVREFAFRLCEFAWLIGCANDYYPRAPMILEKAKPKLIPILRRLGRLDILLDIERFPLDQEGMKVLEKLAFGQEVLLPGNSEYRLPVSIKEAVLGGSRAAQTFLLLEIKYAEKERLEKLHAAEAKRREAERRIAELKK